MKKYIVFALSVLAVTAAFAFEPTWRSSNTATADTTQSLCLSQTYLIGTSTATEGGHGLLHGVCVNTGAVGSLTVYNSSNTAINPVAAINTAAVVPCMFYDVILSSGLTYTNSATANVTILYQCY